MKLVPFALAALILSSCTTTVLQVGPPAPIVDAASDDSAAPSCPAHAPTDYVGCKCGAGTVCVTKPAGQGSAQGSGSGSSGGFAFLDCVPIPPACNGVATCACMGCLCADLGLMCKSVEVDPSTGSGTDLDCR